MLLESLDHHRPARPPGDGLQPLTRRVERRVVHLRVDDERHPVHRVLSHGKKDRRLGPPLERTERRLRHHANDLGAVSTLVDHGAATGAGHRAA